MVYFRRVISMQLSKTLKLAFFWTSDICFIETWPKQAVRHDFYKNVQQSLVRTSLDNKPEPRTHEYFCLSLLFPQKRSLSPQCKIHREVFHSLWMALSSTEYSTIATQIFEIDTRTKIFHLLSQQIECGEIPSNIINNLFLWVLTMLFSSMSMQ